MTNCKGITDKEVIRDQFLQLNSLDHLFPEINILNSYKEDEFSIGHEALRVRYNYYMDIYDRMIEDESYSVLMLDDSMLNMYYIFNEKGEVQYHNLSFMPNYKVDVHISDEEGKTKVQSEDANISHIDLNRRLSNYVRIDYDEKGRQEFVHSLIHLHTSVFKEALRLPVDHYITPFEFLFFILKYIYHNKSDKLKKLEVSLSRSSTLTVEEGKKVRIRFSE